MRPWTLSLAMILAACSSTADRPPASGSTDGGSTTSLDGGAPSADGGRGCTSLVLPTTGTIPESVTNAPAPTPAGGAIADGTYVLTKVQVYVAPAEATTFSQHYFGIVRIAGSAFEAITAIEGVSDSSSAAGTVSTTGSSIAFTRTCPSPAAGSPESYTADPSHLVTSQPFATNATMVMTFTRQ
jgi:hypothetical protein